MFSSFQNSERIDIVLNNSLLNKEKSNELTKCDENILNISMGFDIFKLWSNLKRYFSCKSNEEFISKLLDIAQEYVLKESGSLTSDINKVVCDISTKTSNYPDINLHQTSNVVLQDFEAKNYTKNQESAPSMRLLDTLPVKIKSPQNMKKEQFRLKENDSNCKVPESVIKNEHVEEKVNNICRYCDSKHSYYQCEVNNPKRGIPDSVNIDTWNQNCDDQEDHSNATFARVTAANPEQLRLILKAIINFKLCLKEIKYIGKLKDKLSGKSSEEVNLDDVPDELLKQMLDHKMGLLKDGISLPSCLSFSCTKDSGIVTKISIEPFTEFGPLIGNKLKEVDIHDDCNMKHIWEIQLENGNIYINTGDIRSSNWMRFIRPAPTREDRNLTVVIKENSLYLVSVKSLNAGDELLFWQDTFISNGRKKGEKTVCGGCNMTFDHPLYYKVHCSIFHDVRYSLTIRKYHCKVCGAAVLGKENIRRHATELHNGKGAYQCQFCNKFFLRLSYLEMHRTYGCSSNPLRSKSLCDFCGRKFCQPQKLKIHIKRMHSSITDVLKEFQCQKCMKILGSRAALQRHSKEVHEKQVAESYSCKMCGKHFQNKSNLKIHMLTHSGIKPFKCKDDLCAAAFTTKQCLQLHYRKIHNFDEKNMPKIERSISYTIQAYSGLEKVGNNRIPSENSDNEDSDIVMENCDEDNLEEASSNCDIFDATIDLHSPINMPKGSQSPLQATQLSPSQPVKTTNLDIKESTSRKMISKGSKKWIADEIPTQTVKDLEAFELEPQNQLSKNIEDQSLRKYTSICEFTRRETSNASLLVEAALDSVCNEPSIDVDVEVSHNCNDALVNNIYDLSQNNGLPEVTYNLQDSQDINLISPSVNDHISVTDELDNEIKGNQNIDINYSHLQGDHFRPERQNSPSSISRERNLDHRFSRSHEESDNYTSAQSPRRYDFVENINTEHLSSDESNGMPDDNPNLDSGKDVDCELDMSMHRKSTYKMYDYFKRLKFDENGTSHQNENHSTETNVLDTTSQLEEKDDKDKYNFELAADMRNKFELDLDVRVRHYENNWDAELNRQRPSYDLSNSDLNARSKNTDSINMPLDNRDLGDVDFRSERHFELLALNSSELQGLDMSTRNFHNYPLNISRYHHLYPDIDRMDLRLNYTPPPSYDLVRVVSLDLTPPGRHSVDLSLRSIPLHQIPNSRLLTEHSLSSKHRIFDQARLLAGELSSRFNENRLIPEPSGRLLPDPSSDRILGSNSHLAGTEQSSLLTDEARLLSEHPRFIDQRPLLGDAHILSSASVTATPSMSAFGSYAGVSQSAYHTTPIDPRTHVTSPANNGYHHSYSSYYP